jgi:hypothetical protein
MPNGGSSNSPIQKLTEIEDEKFREYAAQGIQITLDGNLAHLRSIKDTEHKWVDLFSIVTLPAIGYLMTVDATNPVWGWPIAVVVGFYFALTAWLQYVLLRERYSYYSVLRSVVRAQRLLGLFEIGFLSPHFAGSAIPRGFGPHPEADGTQPYSSFLRRQVYVLILFVSLMATLMFRNTFQPMTVGAVIVIVVGLDVLWLIGVFVRDRHLLTTATERERGLAGADPAWFPEV